MDTATKARQESSHPLPHIRLHREEERESSVESS